jgi:hypothetical protein
MVQLEAHGKIAVVITLHKCVTVGVCNSATVTVLDSH